MHPAPRTEHGRIPHGTAADRSIGLHVECGPETWTKQAPTMSRIPMFKEKIALALALILAVLAGRPAHGDEAAGEDRASSFPVLAGIGLAVSMKDSGPQVGVVLPGSAAEKSGRLKPGDRLLSVRDGARTIDLKGKSMGEVVSLIRGPVGTTVTLEVLPAGGGSPSLVTLTREPVRLQGRPASYGGLIGKPLPDVRFSTLDRSTGVALSRYAGRVLVIDFWASWCGTCYAPVDRMQEIARAHPEWKDRVALLTATIDTDLPKASRVVQAKGWKETAHLALSAEELDATGIVAVPAVIVLSPDGRVVAAGDSHSIAIEDEVARLLSRGPAGRPEKP
jgi:thiol-disulfide isomerase/thioredoxin